MGNSFIAIFNSHQMQMHKEVYYQFFFQFLVQRDLIYVYVNRISGIILVCTFVNRYSAESSEIGHHFLKNKDFQKIEHQKNSLLNYFSFMKIFFGTF